MASHEMAEWFANGRIVDVALAMTALEALLVAGYFRRTGRGVAPADFLGNIASGVCLMLALRCGVTGAAWPWIALFLLAALAAHLADLRQRWR